MKFNSIEEKRAYEKGKKIEGELSDALNSMCYSEFVMMGFLDAFERDHRSLQSEILRLVILLINRAASLGTDARNEAAIRVMKVAVKAIEGVMGKVYDPDPDRRKTE